MLVKKILRPYRKRIHYLIEIYNLRNQLAKREGLRQLVEIVQSYETFRADQVKEEIEELLAYVEDRTPKTLCEIGSRRGGTLALFSNVAASDADIFAIDIGYSNLQERYLKKIVLRKQRLTLSKGNSQSPETIERFRRWLDGRTLDFLFIDGDHSYSGVQADYENYSRFVGPGGIIAFHDIHTDFRARYGIQTSSNTGEVPQFWHEISQNENSKEIIHDIEQDGFGIGIIFK